MGVKKKQSTESSIGLSFLDVLCCGLGASVLLLLIVKHEPSTSANEEIEILAGPEIESLESRINELDGRIASKKRSLEKLKRDELDAIQSNSSINTSNENATKELRNIQIKLVRARNQEMALIDAIERAKGQITKEKRKAEEPRSKTSGALDGVQLSDTDKVVIILDVSASMMHWSLVEIFRLQASNVKDPMLLSKWRQAVNAVRYAYDSINSGNRFQFLMFSEEVYDLTGKTIGSKKIHWERKNKEAHMDQRKINNQEVCVLTPKNSLYTCLTKVDSNYHDELVSELPKKIKPKKGTDLSKVIDVVSRLVPKPNKILLVTDGLPNKLQGRDLSKLVGCPKERKDRLQQKKIRKISGACRGSIAMKSIEPFSTKLSHVPIDIILLPLEGDYGAVRIYTLLSASSSGRLTTPAYDWLID